MGHSGLDAMDNKILGFVERYVRDELMAPRLQDIANEVGISVVSVWNRVQSLVAQGYLQQEPRQDRTIRPGRRLRSR